MLDMTSTSFLQRWVIPGGLFQLVQGPPKGHQLGVLLFDFLIQVINGVPAIGNSQVRMNSTYMYLKNQCNLLDYLKNQ